MYLDNRSMFKVVVDWLNKVRKSENKLEIICCVLWWDG